MSSRQVFKYTLVVLATLFAIYVLVRGHSIIINLLVAILIASAIRPVVARLITWHVPSPLAIMGVYLTIGVTIFSLAILVFPPIINQVYYYMENENRLAYQIIRAQREIEDMLGEVGSDQDVEIVKPQQVHDGVREVGIWFRGTMPNLVDDVGSLIGQIVLVMVLGAYWLTSRHKAIDFIQQLFPQHHRIRVQNVIDEIEFTLGKYVRSAVMIGIIIGSINFVILLVLGVPNAALIGVIIGVTTTIPMIGGFLGGAIAVVLTLVQMPDRALTVALVAFLVQLLEAYYVSPRLTSRAASLDPLLVIIYSTIGFATLGIVGAWVAVPVMSVVHILFNQLVINPHMETMRMFRIENGLIIMNPESEPAAQSRSEVLDDLLLPDDTDLARERKLATPNNHKER